MVILIYLQRHVFPVALPGFARDDLLQLLRAVDGELDARMTLVLVGGTALTFLDLKDSTRDIDLLIPSERDRRRLCRSFSALGFRELSPIRWETDRGYTIDLFAGNYVFVVGLLDDFLELSPRVGSFRHIALHALDPYDLVITKLARSDPRDLDDIRTMFERCGLDRRRLIERYIGTMGEASVVRHDKENLLHLFERCLPEWGMAADAADLEVIRAWKRESGSP